MNHNSLGNMNNAFDIIFKGDDRIEHYREDTMLRGDPDAVLRARDEKEIRQALVYCNENKIPVTFCASQTSMTGASVATDGLLISTEKLEGVSDIGIYQGRAVAIIRPGTVVADAQAKIAEAGYFFPVAPTSRDECRIGANVCTNSTGEDSFKYGPIRSYVRRLRIILADGAEKIVERLPDELPSAQRNRAGYFTEWKNPIDLFIGSEGTLGFIAEVMVDLLPRSPNFFSAMAPFPTNRKALECLVQAINKSSKTLRALEYVDSGALNAMKTAENFPNFPEGTNALIYFKEEFENQNERDSKMGEWYESILSFSSHEFADSILVALTHKQTEEFRLWRHRIPEWANEEGRKFWSSGGGKIGSDWWVPQECILEMMEYFYKEAQALGLPYMAYAHLGSGHPHTNVITKDKNERRKGEELLISCCKKAVELGGGVAGEHGIGKIHRNLVSIQYDPEVVDKMRQWKKEYDPNWIIGRGNILVTV